MAKASKALPVYNTARKALGGLYQSAESNLLLAKHAETWEWKEVSSSVVLS